LLKISGQLDMNKNDMRTLSGTRNDRKKLKENTRGFDGNIPSLAKEKRHSNKKERQMVRRGLMNFRYEEE
jgi:hypothetical protein